MRLDYSLLEVILSFKQQQLHFVQEQVPSSVCVLFNEQGEKLVLSINGLFNKRKQKGK